VPRRSGDPVIWQKTSSIRSSDRTPSLASLETLYRSTGSPERMASWCGSRGSGAGSTGSVGVATAFRSSSGVRSRTPTRPKADFAYLAPCLSPLWGEVRPCRTESRQVVVPHLYCHFTCQRAASRPFTHLKWSYHALLASRSPRHFMPALAGGHLPRLRQNAFTTLLCKHIPPADG
jgi:hypothetical protein